VLLVRLISFVRWGGRSWSRQGTYSLRLSNLAPELLLRGITENTVFVASTCWTVEARNPWAVVEFFSTTLSVVIRNLDARLYIFSSIIEILIGKQYE
jgi:hypothetical protein